MAPERFRPGEASREEIRNEISKRLSLIQKRIEKQTGNINSDLMALSDLAKEYELIAEPQEIKQLILEETIRSREDSLVGYFKSRKKLKNEIQDKLLPLYKNYFVEDPERNFRIVSELSGELSSLRSRLLEKQ